VRVAVVVKEDKPSFVQVQAAADDAQSGHDGHPGGTRGAYGSEPGAPVHGNGGNMRGWGNSMLRGTR
jgi:hypothetical protein